jgi:hypothetical protein
MLLLLFGDLGKVKGAHGGVKVSDQYVRITVVHPSQ